MNKQQNGNTRRSAQSMMLWEARRSEIVRLYEVEQLPQATVAAHFGVSQTGLQKAMLRLGIPSRTRANVGERNGRYRHGKATRLYRTMTAKDSCRMCEATANLCIHHKDGNHYNNVAANLEVLCMSCHSSMHKKAWWDSRKAGQSAQTRHTG